MKALEQTKIWNETSEQAYLDLFDVSIRKEQREKETRNDMGNIGMSDDAVDAKILQPLDTIQVSWMVACEHPSK